MMRVDLNFLLTFKTSKHNNSSFLCLCVNCTFQQASLKKKINMPSLVNVKLEHDLTFHM